MLILQGYTSIECRKNVESGLVHSYSAMPLKFMSNFKFLTYWLQAVYHCVIAVMEEENLHGTLQKIAPGPLKYGIGICKSLSIFQLHS